ncbi:MAG: putative prophage phiRv2 integrase [Firmicutes bacterium ADurb.Bin506]|nr:MAG: putative prophage phiRv2 integrase [Firmicutes bacterium ADurb.Bin506]
MPVYKDEARGTWYASFYYTDWTGKRRLKKKRGFERKKDGQEYEREFLAKQQQSCDMTFASLVELYNADMEARLRLSTRKNKEHLMERHIMPFFRELRVNEITPAHVRKWQAGLMAGKYAPTYLKSINNQLVALLNYAVKYYHLPNNPCHAAGAMGKKKAQAMKFWTVEQYNTFLACVTRPSARAGFSILFWTGIRIGELLALTLEDFDFEKNTLSITKSYQNIEGKDIISEPKTERGRRVVPLPEELLSVARVYLAALYDYRPGERLFPFTKSYFHKQMAKGCAASGVEKIRLHDLRHSHASLLIEMGVPILLISERLGHEDVETTLRTYGHLYPHRNDDTMKLLNDLMVPRVGLEDGVDDEG